MSDREARCDRELSVKGYERSLQQPVSHVALDHAAGSEIAIRIDRHLPATEHCEIDFLRERSRTKKREEKSVLSHTRGMRPELLVLGAPKAKAASIR